MLNKYVKDTSGNMATIFAVSLLAIMAGVGAAVDYNGMTNKRASYQNIADAAVLAAARAGSSDHDDLLNIARDSVDAHNMSGDALTTTMTFVGDGKVQVFVKGSYDTAFMSMFGTSNVDVKVVSESVMGVSGYVNLVLVLDGTGSMGYNSRLTNMKDAANKMVRDLDVFENDKLQISVVPFAQYVNVGTSNRNKPWVDVPPDWTETFPETCGMVAPVIGTDSGNCSTTTYPPVPPGVCSNDGVEYACGGSAGSTTTTCANIYGPPVYTCSTPSPRVHTWHGIVGSRNHPWHKRVGYYANKKIPGFIDTTGNVEMLPLTNDLVSVQSKISSVVASGSTYMPAGLMWGWRALNRSAPFTEGASAPEDRVRNIMVFMTDGENTRSLDGNTHNGVDRNDADNLTEELCSNIKGDNIELYSITYEVTDASARSLVSRCASDASMYYDSATGPQLAKAFEDIGKSILSPRITH